MTPSPRVSLILVNYNGYRHLEACLASVRAMRFTDYETLLVDNGSSDGSCEFVRSRYPWVRILELGYNAGFSKANNEAVSRARGDFLAFLNNDVEVQPDWLGLLMQEAESSADAVAWASKMMIFDHRELLNGVGGSMNEIGYTFDRGMYERDYGQYDVPEEVFFPCAGACLVRKQAFLDAGRFDERYFMYHEDVDLGWTLWLLGGRILTVPAAVVYHKFGGTSKATMGLERRETMGERNNICSLIKHYEWPHLARALFLLLSQRQSPARKAQTLRSFLWNIRNLPETLRLRRRIQKGRRRSDAELARLVFPGTKVPLTLPDYPLATAETFLSSGRKVYKITMGENELGCLSYGWHHPEPNPSGDGRTVRWTQKEACLYLSGDGAHRTLCFRCYAMSVSTGVLVSGRTDVDGQTAGSFQCPGEGWQEVRIPLPEKSPVMRVTLKLDATWTPASIFKNDDSRILGVAVHSAWLE